MLIHFRLRERCYCAFCKTPRWVYAKKHVDLTNVVLTGVAAWLATLAVWAELEPRGLMFFVVALMGSEIFIYLRWRMNLMCQLCGFDPIVYKKSPAKACAQVREFFNEQVKNPEFWLTRSPLLQVQRQILVQERKAWDQQVLANRTRSSALAPTRTP